MFQSIIKRLQLLNHNCIAIKSALEIFIRCVFIDYKNYTVESEPENTRFRALIIPLILILFIIMLYVMIPNHTNVQAHIINNKMTTTQQFIDPQNNVKIQFTYEPEKPIVYAYTNLKFSVQKLQTGQHLKDILAKITVTNGQRIFKFNNVTVSDGDFSIKVRFLEEGRYQAIIKIDSNHDAIALASFNVVVPFQPIGTINVDNIMPLIIPVLIVGIIGLIVIVTFIIVVRVKERMA